MSDTQRKGMLRHWASLGIAVSDSQDLRLKKAVMTIGSTSIAILAIFWGILYIYSGYRLSGAIPLSYSVISFSSTLYFFKTKHFGFYCFSQQLLILILPFLLMWSLGGFANGSVVMIWAFFAPLAALFFINLRAAARWMLAFLALLIFSAVFNQYFAIHAQPMPVLLNTVYFLMNIGCGFILVALSLYYFVKDREHAYAQLQQSEMHIRELMLTDPLTGVANRRHLDDRLSLELDRQARYGHSLAVVMADIDWFKQINDNYGHAVGDSVLKTVATSLQQIIRSSDFLARYGGEEFVLLFPNTTGNEAVSLAERMRTSIKDLKFENMNNKGITTSFGIILTRSGETKEQAVERADKAMYVSKSHGRDQVTLVDESDLTCA